MKRPLILALILAALLAFILFTLQKGETPLIETQTSTQRGSRKSAHLLLTEKASSASQSPAKLLSLVEMMEAKYVPDHAVPTRSRENPQFQFIGNDAVGRVVDQNGKVLIESGKEIAILGIAIGPASKRLLVAGGDAINFILTPSENQKLKLPVYPPGANMLGFGSWHWISETKLLGVSGVQALNAKGTPVNCCEGHNVAQTKLYVYDVIAQQLAEVALPSKVTQSVVNVTEVSPDGHVHLFHEEPHVGTEQDLGWFKIQD